MRKTLVVALCAGLLVATPAGAVAQTGSLGSLEGGSSSSEPAADPRVAALKQAVIQLHESLGNVYDAEAEKEAEKILVRALNEEFIYEHYGFFGIGTTGVYGQIGGASVSRIYETYVDSLIDYYQQPGDYPRSSDRIGVAVGKIGSVFYLVQYYPRDWA